MTVRDTFTWIDLTPDLSGQQLTIGRLRDVLAEVDLPPDTPVHSGYYRCDGVNLRYRNGQFEQFNISNDE